jgi:hypothetical protein
MRRLTLTMLLVSAFFAFGACEKGGGPEAVAPATTEAAATTTAQAGEPGATGATGEAKACCGGAAKAEGGEQVAQAGEGKAGCTGDCAGCENGCEGGCANCKGGDACSCPNCKAKGGDCKGNCGGDCKGNCGGDCKGNCGGDCKGAAAAGTSANAADEANCPFADADKPAPGAAASGESLEPGCPHAASARLAEGAGGAAVDAPAGDKHFGQPFALTEAKPLATVLATEPPPSETAVLVSGVIDQVCQKKGCWMVVRDGEKTARITMKDYAFVVPVDSKGKQVTIEGTIAVRTFTEAQVKHLEADRGGNPDDVSGTRTEYVVKASGVRIRG